MRDLQIVSLAASQVAGRLTALQAAYEAVYAIPPGEGRQIVPALIDHIGREGFRLRAALGRGESQLAGFAYGFTGQPGQAWRDDMARAVGTQVAAEWLEGHFEFAEFGVIPEERRRGIGTRLQAALLEGLPHTRAVLTVRDGNRAGLAFYRRHGWVPLHEGFVSTDGHGPYIIMGRMLHPR